MRTLLIPLILPAALLLAGCGGQASPAAPAGEPTAAPVTAPTPPPDATAPPPRPTDYPAPAQPAAGTPYPNPSPAPGVGSGEATHDELVREAQARLAQHLGVAPDALTLSGETRQEWPDASLGCPAPDTTYAQYVVPGYLLEFSDGQRTYAVHTGLQALPGEPMVFCDGGRPVDLSAPRLAPALDATGQAMVEKAKQDLARLLEIDVQEITVIRAEPVEWNDSSLGCPQPDASYLQVITPGYQIELSAQGQPYTYHTDTSGVVIRCEKP
ncbi:MAG TPA: hypothetical protein VNL77_14090 [Roseiflexaceae bacterium]|nr:hypothetical protein [Roseiflexaceae bacterium]